MAHWNANSFAIRCQETDRASVELRSDSNVFYRDSYCRRLPRNFVLLAVLEKQLDEPAD